MVIIWSKMTILLIQLLMVEKKTKVRNTWFLSQPWTFQPWIFQPQTWGWKVRGWEIWGWKVHGWKVWGWKVPFCFGVEKFMVENSRVERSGVEAWGWKVRGWNVLQPAQRIIWKIVGFLNPKVSLPILMTLTSSCVSKQK